MPQRKKEEVADRIAEAALRVFARDGYEGATMAEIASEASISTGNVYRYHASKEALFNAVVPYDIVHRFRTALRARFAAARPIVSHESPVPAEFFRASEEFIDFCAKNRLALLVVLARSNGSVHEFTRSSIETELVDGTIAQARRANPDLNVTADVRFTIRRVYATLLCNLVAALTEYDDPVTLRIAIEGYNEYHYGGIKRLLLGHTAAERSSWEGFDLAPVSFGRRAPGSAEVV